MANRARVILRRGAVIVVALDPTFGHEQQGIRPCVVVSDPEVTADQRFPMIAVVPLTGTPGDGALYPRVAPGGSGLRKVSTALLDQVRAIDKRRVRATYGGVTAIELRAIDDGLALFLGLELVDEDAGLE